MAKPVAVQPPLPNPNGNITNSALNSFDQDMVRALTSYLGGMALRLNATITNDGTEKMKADLDMDGHSLLNVNNITGTGTATFATAAITDLTVTNLTVTGTVDIPAVTDLTLDTLTVNTEASVPTPDPSDDSTHAATTEWVNDAIAAIDTSTFVTLTGPQTITDKTLTEPILMLEQGSAPSATDSGRVQWDTDDNSLVIGTGSDIVRIRGGAWELIEEITFSSQTEVDVLNLSDYRMLRISGRILSTSTAGVPKLQVSTDNGATWITSAVYVRTRNYATSAGGSGSDYGVTTSLGLAGGNNVDSSVGVAFDLVMTEFNKAEFGSGNWQTSYRNSTPTYVQESVGYIIGTTAAYSAIRFTSDQNMDGHIIIEGVRG